MWSGTGPSVAICTSAIDWTRVCVCVSWSQSFGRWKDPRTHGFAVLGAWDDALNLNNGVG